MRHIRVQQQGGCTPTVSIPQEFAQELGIRKGDSLRVTVEDLGGRLAVCYWVEKQDGGQG